MSTPEALATPSRWRRALSDIGAVLRSAWRDELDVPYEQLRSNEALYRLMTERAQDIIWLLDFPDKTTYVSPSCQRILGWSPTEQYGRRGGLKMLTDESAERAGRQLTEAIANREPSVTYEAEHNRADGSTVWCEVHQAILYDDDGKAVSSVGITRDITETRKLQEQLTIAQKAEVIGVVAGGVAHDFNNFLTVIIGSLDLMVDELPKTSPAAQLVDDAVEAAEKAAALTAQLLGFSRHQPVSIGAVDVNEVVLRADPLFDRVVGERVRVDTVLARGLSLACGDENQLNQVLLNLVINARDAITGDGCITIETANVMVDAELAAQRNELSAGRFVMLAVSDDGCGMSPEVLERATDPFFTTKPKGSGTGLGLAMAQSIVQRLGGDLSIYSEVGSGTTVKTYLPISDREEGEPLWVDAADLGVSLRGSETILVVEDEDTVRAVACQILGQMGYRVFSAASPAAALERLEALAASDTRVDLVLSDLVMPGMNGTQLADRIRASDPSVRFVIMSGYAENGASNLSKDRLPGPLLMKPFHANGLLRVVRSVLGDPTTERS